MPAARQGLAATLDALAQPVTFWWRDDDAGRDHPRLARLLALAVTRKTPVALAVVPDWLEPAAAERIMACPEAAVLQHGIAHLDHSQGRGKRIELGGAMPAARLADSLRQAMDCLHGQIGRQLLPVLVPPWNRIGLELLPHLAGLGYAGLSRFGRRAAPLTAGLCEINTHVDLILWREQRRPLSAMELEAALVRALDPPPDEPVGILSHHLVMDRSAFEALDRVLALLQDHPKARLAGAQALFRGEE